MEDFSDVFVYGHAAPTPAFEAFLARLPAARREALRQAVDTPTARARARDFATARATAAAYRVRAERAVLDCEKAGAAARAQTAARQRLDLQLVQVLAKAHQLAREQAARRR